MSLAPEDPFWEFSLAVYGRPGVAEACLALQDRRGLDVNILLFCCWAGSRGHALRPPQLERLTTAVRHWREAVVEPLRAVRRWLKDQECAPVEAAALRGRIKEQELEAERIAQRILAQALALGEGEASPATAAASLRAYLDLSQVRRQPDDTAELAALLTGCFEDLTPLEALRLLG